MICLPGFAGEILVFDTHLSWIVQEGATPESALRLAWRPEYEYYALVPQERPMLGDDGPSGPRRRSTITAHGSWAPRTRRGMNCRPSALAEPDAQ